MNNLRLPTRYISNGGDCGLPRCNSPFASGGQILLRPNLLFKNSWIDFFSFVISQKKFTILCTIQTNIKSKYPTKTST
jgi:hypothetical protein